jgi:predicted RNase H-like nuclease (RuvC/YqgF family)
MFIYEEDEEDVYADLMNFKKHEYVPTDVSNKPPNEDAVEKLNDRVTSLEKENVRLANEVNQLKSYLKSIMDSVSSEGSNHPLYRK